jgi:GT2 family glycosyltransferase
VITTNYNSKPYLPIAKLSLYSVFKAVMEINKQDEYRILLVDSSSTDGSFEELCELGEKLSMETKIPFETIQLRKDLGNSFAYAYGFLYSRNKGADYIIYMDNDFIITNPKTLLEMQKLAEKLSRANIKYYAVASMFVLDNRERGLRIARSNIDPRSAVESMQTDIEINPSGKILATNIAYVDILGRIIHPFDCNLLECKNNAEIKKEFILSSFVPSTFSLHPSQVAPIFPLLYIWGDDQITAINHTLRGYYSFIVPGVLGIHYIESTRKRSSPRKAYYSLRNLVLSNFLIGRNKYLFYTVTSLYKLFIWAPLSLVELKKYIKMKYYALGGYAPPSVTMHAVAGFIHGLLIRKKVERSIDKWFRKYLGEPPRKDFLDYFTYKGIDNANIARLLLYIITGKQELLVGNKKSLSSKHGVYKS